jgi:TPR repeat protein
MNDPGVSLSHLEYLALEKGDTDAYETLDIAYLDYPQGDFFPIAKKMADKYDYPQAYFDVYFQLLKPTRASGTTLSLDSCDEKTRKIALSYLIQAYNKGHHQAPLELSNLYYEGKFVPKDTILSKKLENRADSIMTELIEKSKK